MENLVSISIVVLIIYSIGMTVNYVVQKSKNRLRFEELSGSNGPYGMNIMESPLDNSHMKFFVEFKVLQKAKKKDNRHNKIKIHVLSVKLRDLSILNSVLYKDNANESIDLLKKTSWITESSDIYWFDDNETRRRDEIINELLK